MSSSKSVLAKIVSSEHLTRGEAHAWMSQVLAGELPAEQIAGALCALRTRGETPDEVLGFADGLMDRAKRLRVNKPIVMDVCGTGGDGLNLFNVSTATALVVASLGVTVAKHGNRSVSSKCGSSDVLEALGVPLSGNVALLEEAIDRFDIAFLFAPWHHPAMKAVVPIRRALAIPTVFNMLGPMVNPANLTHQLVGVPRPDFEEIYTKVYTERDISAAIVHGHHGADEALPTGVNRVTHVCSSKVELKHVIPEENGVETTSLEALAGGDVATNAQILKGVLAGNPEHGAAIEAVALNAGIALELCGKAASIAEGAQMSREAMRGGAPLALLEEYAAFIRAAEG